MNFHKATAKLKRKLKLHPSLQSHPVPLTLPSVNLTFVQESPKSIAQKMLRESKNHSTRTDSSQPLIKSSATPHACYTIHEYPRIENFWERKNDDEYPDVYYDGTSQ